MLSALQAQSPTLDEWHQAAARLGVRRSYLPAGDLGYRPEPLLNERAGNSSQSESAEPAGSVTEIGRDVRDRIVRAAVMSVTEPEGYLFNDWTTDRSMESVFFDWSGERRAVGVYEWDEQERLISSSRLAYEDDHEFPILQQERYSYAGPLVTAISVQRRHGAPTRRSVFSPRVTNYRAYYESDQLAALVDEGPEYPHIVYHRAVLSDAVFSARIEKLAGDLVRALEPDDELRVVLDADLPEQIGLCAWASSTTDWTDVDLSRQEVSRRVAAEAAARRQVLQTQERLAVRMRARLEASGRTATVEVRLD